MLTVAAGKHPNVPVARTGLQELPFLQAFDAVMCVNAIENVGPEDWPTVLVRLRNAGRPEACLYVTVELGDEDDVRRAYEKARAAGHPAVPGEDFDGTRYHYYPEPEAIQVWLQGAGLGIVDEREADEYRHLLLRRRSSGT